MIIRSGNSLGVSGMQVTNLYIAGVVLIAGHGLQKP